MDLPEVELFFPNSSPHRAVLAVVARKVLVTTQLVSAVEQCSTASRMSLKGSHPLTRRLGVSKILGGHMAKTADPK